MLTTRLSQMRFCKHHFLFLKRKVFFFFFFWLPRQQTPPKLLMDVSCPWLHLDCILHSLKPYTSVHFYLFSPPVLRCTPSLCARPGSWHVPTLHLGTMWRAEAWTTSAPSTAWRPARATCESAESSLDTRVHTHTHTRAQLDIKGC